MFLYNNISNTQKHIFQTDSHAWVIPKKLDLKKQSLQYFNCEKITLTNLLITKR
jgi:hypothetical protein